MKRDDHGVVELRRRISQLTEEARKNEDTWKRSQRSAMALLEAKDLATLLGQLTDGLLRDYRLQATTLTLVDPDHEIRNLLSSEGNDPELFTGVFFIESVGEAPPELRARARTWLGAFGTHHESLFPGAKKLASVALLPLVRESRIVGSLHFGSRDSHRFTKKHATDFLNHLATVASFGLENAVNRAKLVRSGFTDVLTGWHNRSYLQIRLQEELARSQREQTALVCLMLDVDHFKRVNDEHGHSVGDAVLREVARRVSGEVRSSDISARYGGEEFIVLLPRTRLETAQHLAERIRATVSASPFGVGTLETPLPVTVSIGLAEFLPKRFSEDPAIAGERLIAEADEALYEAKATGRNTVVLARGSVANPACAR